MSVSRPARCFFANPSIPTLQPRIRCRNFHASPNLSARRRPRHPSVKAAAMGLVRPKKSATELFKQYSEEEKTLLAQKYTPEQIRAIEAGEQAVRPEDLDSQGVIRTDIGSLPYLDDLSHYRNVVDKKPRDSEPIDPNVRFMTEDELATAWHETFDRIEAENPPPKPRPVKYNEKGQEVEDKEPPPFNPTRMNVERTNYEAPAYMGTHGPLRTQQNMFAPAFPKVVDIEDAPPTKKKTEAEKEEEEVDQRDQDGIYNQLRKQTGYSLDEIFDFKVKILVKHNVVNQTRMGKIASLYCLAIAGNGNGLLGIGQAKGQETENTQNLARIAAIRNMQPIPRYEERTIFGEVEGKVSAVEVKLMARPPGFGLRCQHNIFEMARAAGIHDLAARVPRSRNKMNTIKATYQALMKQRIPDEIARGRGKKLVDVRKVYYGGRV